MKSERIKIVMEQYKLLEERRKTFGNQFMQVIGFFIALFILTTGTLAGKNSTIFNIAMMVSGVAFIIIAFLGYRLGKRQDDCELQMEETEKLLGEILESSIVKLPHGAKFGARIIIVTFLVLAGLLLFLAGLLSIVF